VTRHILADKDMLLLALALLLIPALLIRCTVLSGDQVRRMVWRTRARMRPGPGFASQWEITLHFGRLAAVWHGRRARRDLTFRGRFTRGAHHYATRLGRGMWLRRLYVPGEEHVIIVAPPRTFKSGHLADRLLCHPGSAVSCTTRADVLELTSGQRARMGPVQVFNPEGIGGAGSTFRVDIVRDCADPEVARQTAAALVGPVSPGEDAQWQRMARSALAGLLHAAAIRRGDMSDVWMWVTRLNEHQVQEARTMPGASLDTLAPAIALQQSSKTQDSIRAFAVEAIAWVTSPRLMGMVSGPDLVSFDAEQWIESCGTIYFISSGEETSGAPLFRAVIEKIYRDCRLAGSVTPYGRIPNPVLFALDEVTQTAAVPLKEWLATAAGDGIQVCPVVHTPAQLRDRYGPDAADVIWQLAGVKMLLGGNTDPHLAEAVSKVCGTIPSGEGRDRPVVPVAYLRRLPAMHALVIVKNRNLLAVKIRPAWKRPARRLLLRPLSRRLGLLHPPAIPQAAPSAPGLREVPPEGMPEVA